MDNCVLKPVWSTLKPVILAKFLTGANRLQGSKAKSAL
jgi:hypothetical protein